MSTELDRELTVDSHGAPADDDFLCAVPFAIAAPATWTGLGDLGSPSCGCRRAALLLPPLSCYSYGAL